MGLQTLNDILLAVAKSGRNRVMLQRGTTGWVPISSAEIYRSVVGVARALGDSWGVRKGDRVAILSENRPEWTIADFAALSLGAVTVPVYSTQTPEQTAFLLNDSGARIIAVSTKHQLEKILTIQRDTVIERIMVMDAVDSVHAVQMQGLMFEGPTAPDANSTLVARDLVRPDDLRHHYFYARELRALLKGAMFTHGKYGVEHCLFNWRRFAFVTGRSAFRSFAFFPRHTRGTSICDA